MPASLPFNLGTLPAGGSTVLDADFSGGPFTYGGTYPLTVAGMYAEGAATYCFGLNTDLVVPPAAPPGGPVNIITQSEYQQLVQEGVQFFPITPRAIAQQNLQAFLNSQTRQSLKTSSPKIRIFPAYASSTRRRTIPTP